MIEFNPETFEFYFRALVADPETDLELDEIDDALLRATLNSDGARACAYLAVEILSNASRPWPLAYALNTAIGASCIAQDTERARRYLRQLVDLTIKDGTDLAALSAAENIRRLLPESAKADHAPNVLYEVVRLYVHLGDIEKAVEILIVVANLFADFGAFQSAYRSLGDAEDIARDNNLLQQYVDVVSTMYSVCLLEEDHSYAEEIWPTLIQKYAELGKPVPTYLAVNRATAFLQVGDRLAARSAFESALQTIENCDEMRSKVLINLSACLREIGEHGLSGDRMSEARKLMSELEDVDPEHSLELELIASKNAIAKGDFFEAASCLKRAVVSLDAGVGQVEKLHYRRGFRERYVPRIEQLLVSLSPAGRAADIVPVIAATRANRVTDWLHFLDWAEALSEKLPLEERAVLGRLVDDLAQHGSPHLFGYLEKYDDPMSGIPKADPWRDIVGYADVACAPYRVNRPFQEANSKRSAAIIAERLDEGYAFLVNMWGSDHKMLLLIGDRYLFCELPQAETRDFLKALLRHRQEPGQAKALGRAIDLYQTALLDSLAPALSELIVENCKGVIFIPDRMDLTPINLAMVGDPRIRARMAAGEFEVRTCIALHPTTRTAGAPESCLGIIEINSGLQYDRTDVDGFFKGVGTDGTVLEGPEWSTFATKMASTDALVLSHHGTSIGLFRDPFFADMAGVDHESVMRLMSLQGSTFRWPHRLVVLGTCHSGALVNRNYQTPFRSHDLMGFPVVFLLNGRSEVLAASWAILDRFNLLFTTLFAPSLHQAHPSQAASTALARLFELPKEELPDLLLRAFPPGVQVTQELLSQMDTLRRQPFCYGAYHTYTLL